MGEVIFSLVARALATVALLADTIPQIRHLDKRENLVPGTRALAARMLAGTLRIAHYPPHCIGATRYELRWCTSRFRVVWMRRHRYVSMWGSLNGDRRCRARRQT